MSAEQVHARHHLGRPRFVIAQPQILGNHHQMNLHLDAGEKLPDAVSWAGAEGAHRQPVLIVQLSGCKSIRIEAVWNLQMAG